MFSLRNNKKKVLRSHHYRSVINCITLYLQGMLNMITLGLIINPCFDIMTGNAESQWNDNVNKVSYKIQQRKYIRMSMLWDCLQRYVIIINKKLLLCGILSCSKNKLRTIRFREVSRYPFDILTMVHRCLQFVMLTSVRSYLLSSSHRTLQSDKKYFITPILLSSLLRQGLPLDKKLLRKRL